MTAAEISSFDLTLLVFLASALLGAAWFAVMYGQRQRRRDALEEAKWRANNEMNSEDDMQSAEASNPLGGYVFVDVDDENKGLFHDTMRGFEEFARLKGYRVSIAIDTSPPGKVGLRFTILDQGVTVATETVKSHVDEYIAQFSESSPFDNMPIVIEAVEHERLKAGLTARFMMVKNNAEMHKTAADFYRGLLTDLAQLKSGGVGYLPVGPTIIHNQLAQGEANMTRDSYLADHSPGAAVGKHNVALVEGSSISVGTTNSEQNARITALEELIELVVKSDLERREDAARYLMNAKEDMEDGDPPDPNLIGRFLGKAKEVLMLAHEGTAIYNKTKEVLSIFGMVV